MKSMYIHIPFCSSICSYCDFTKMYYNPDMVKRYLKALKEEIEDRYNDEELETLYIGGGTPSSLSIQELKDLSQILKLLNLEKIKEFTIECNINDIIDDKIKIIKNMGVNRISIGVESFNKNKLKFMERNADFNDTKEKITLIKNYGINNINIDLMYAIPNETLKDLKKDLKLILKLKPNHISTYSLILEEHTKVSNNNTKSISEDLEIEMYNYIKNKLKRKKYNHYEISNFGLAGYESIHNLTYWNNEEYYGFGLGAHGYIDGIRYENTKNIDKYTDNIFVEKEEILSLKDKKENEVMLGLRKIKGINIEEYYNKYESNIQDDFPIKPLLKNKDLIYKDKYLFINPEKVYIMNEILLKLI